jgi:putative polyketide hydroxylase
MYDEDVQVLIVGGGIVGLSAAAFLASRGVSTQLVERRPDALAHPRARVINPRTVELYRQIGLEEAIQAARSRAYYSTGLVIRAETMTAQERATDEMRASPAPGRADNVSPASWIPIDQDALERVVRRRASELGADVRLSTELVGFEHDGSGVLARLRELPSGPERTVRSAYLIAADGHRSGVRSQLGIGLAGPGILDHIVCFVFEADLSGPLRGRHLAVGHFDRPRHGTSVISHSEGRWVLSMPYRPDEGESLESFTEERCAGLARAAVGLPDLELSLVPQLPNGIMVLGYEISAFVADRFRAGPVFLAGDSAHAMPPAGAFGAGTGIQDAHNLAWKMAAVLHGQAAPELLASYDTERRPVATFTVGQSLHLLRARTGRPLPFADVGPQVEYDEVLYGYRYLDGALRPPAGRGSRASVPPASLDGTPGTRAPHVPLDRGGQRISSLDLYGQRLVLLCGPGGAAWALAMSALRGAYGLPVDIYRVGTDLLDAAGPVAGQIAGRYGIGSAGAVLIRPDGFVAWRASGPAWADPARILQQVLASCGLAPPMVSIAPWPGRGIGVPAAASAAVSGAVSGAARMR